MHRRRGITVGLAAAVLVLAASEVAGAAALTGIRAQNGLAGGGGHALAVKQDGTVWAWGYNAHGQVGIGRTGGPVTEPTKVEGVADVTAAAGGEFHSLVLTADHSVWAFGENDKGQLGTGRASSPATSPVKVPRLTDVTAIDADGDRSYALQEDGTLLAWGENDSGQLGNGSKEDSSSPVPVDLDGVSAVAAGGEHTLALKDGAVFGWGQNRYGQLGDGHQCNTSSATGCDEARPVETIGLPGKVTAIAAGQLGDYSLALLEDGTVMAWGRNDQGQAGQGSVSSSGCKCEPKPKKVTGLRDVQAIAASGGAGVALKKDGTVWVWGNNEFGQLGNGKKGGSSGTPTQVRGLQATAIAAGGGYILARKASGAVVGWGINSFGELGVGDTEHQARPVAIGVAQSESTSSAFDTPTLPILLALVVVLLVVVLLFRRRPQLAMFGNKYDTGPGVYDPGWPAAFSPTRLRAAHAGTIDDAFEEYSRRIRLLSRVDLFASASHDQLAQLAVALRPIRVSEGDVVCRQGDEGDELFLVESATLRILAEVGGQERELARLGPGEFFGEGALVGEGRRTATVQAATDGDLWAMSSADLRVLTDEHPEITDVLRRAAAQRAGTDRVFEVEGIDATADGRPITIGRSPDNDIVFTSPLVAAHHAVIEPVAGGGLRLRDLGSPIGSHVNHAKVKTAELHDGDEIWIGDQRFLLDQRALRRLVEPQGIRLDALGLTTEVGDGKRILDGVDLSILPGEFVAIVGGSGAGKTTLLEALSGARPPTEGQVLYGGRDYYEHIELFRNQLGYVPQDDIIHLGLPLGLTLRHAAKLRLPPDTPADQLDRAVADALAELELTEHADTRVGSLSGGQRKRCSIGVELLTKPRIFFLDEPTSGLDPYTDGQMMGLLRTLADGGSTVVLTTHATRNVSLCDKVVFLARGGRIAFVGTPQRALRYFDVDTFEDIYRRLAEEGSPEEWGDRFGASEDHRQVVAEQLHTGPTAGAGAGAGAAGRTSLDASRPGGFRLFVHQLRVLSRRNRDLFLKNPQTLPSLVMPPVLFTLLALCLFKDGAFERTANSAASLQILFLIAFSAFIFGLLYGVQEIVGELAIVRRERMVNLGVVPYVLSKTTFLLPLLTVMLIVMVAVLRLFGRLPDDGWDVYWRLLLTIVLTGFAGFAFALFTSALVNTSQQATDMLSVWIMPQVLFGGALLAVPAMNLIGRVISALAPVRWAFEALGNIVNLSDQFRTDTSRIGPGLAIQYGDSFERNPVENWVILAIFIAVPLVLTCLVLRRRTTATSS